MIIIDNFLSEYDFKRIKSKILSPNFTWRESLIVPNDRFNSDYNYKIYNKQLVHPFYSNYIPFDDTYFDLIPLVEKIGPRSLIKIKANLIERTDKLIVHGFHTDVDEDYYGSSSTAIFYINSNNGFTSFQNGEKVSSKENRLLVFSSEIEHSGSSCTDEEFRVAINLNFF